MSDINIYALKNSIEYQDHSAVSKTLLDKKAGTITLFAFDVGQGLSEHTAPFDATVQILDGKASVNIDSKDYEVGAGELVIMPANKPHSLRAPDKFKMVLVMIRA